MNIDTLTIARELRAAELPAGQAEAITAAIGKSIGETAATKADLRELEARIDLFRQEVDAKLERFKNEVVRWFLASQITTAAVIIAAIKL
ncbi:MAG: hypothetical protein ABW203_03135 [Novosphingobium sp.]